MAITVRVMTVITAKIASWILVSLSCIRVRPLLSRSRSGRNLERIRGLSGQVGHLAGQEVRRVEDLVHVGHVRIEIGRREEGFTKAAQGEVEGREHVEVVATHGLLDAEV